MVSPAEESDRLLPGVEKMTVRKNGFHHWLSANEGHSFNNQTYNICNVSLKFTDLFQNLCGGDLHLLNIGLDLHRNTPKGQAGHFCDGLIQMHLKLWLSYLSVLMKLILFTFSIFTTYLCNTKFRSHRIRK